MRWEHLFADLEARFDELDDAAAAAETADRERVAMGAVLAQQRLVGSIGGQIRSDWPAEPRSAACCEQSDRTS